MKKSGTIWADHGIMEMKLGFFDTFARGIFHPCVLCIPCFFPALGQAEALPDFEREVKPVLAKRCYGCHGAEKQKGKLRLDTMSTDLLKDPKSDGAPLLGDLYITLMQQLGMEVDRFSNAKRNLNHLFA